MTSRITDTSPIYLCPILNMNSVLAFAGIRALLTHIERWIKMKYFIKKNERGLLFKNGDYIQCLQPGQYTFLSFLKYDVIILDINKPFHTIEYDLELFIDDNQLLEELDILDVKDNEVAIHYIDGKLSNIYETGKYAFWNVHK